MEVPMELTKKTTILFPPDLHRRLAQMAKTRGVSIGELVRNAVAAHYGILSREERVRAARELCAMSLPVGSVRRMKRESVPTPESLLP